MAARLILITTVLLTCFGMARAEAPGAPDRQADAAGWRPATAPAAPAVAPNGVIPAAAVLPVSPAPVAGVSGTPVAGPVAAPRPTTRVTNGNGTLPSEAGQVWREYDINPYTVNVTSTDRPEQAIIDWILRETGYEAWHSEPLGILSATKKTLRVYHTPQMQARVAELVDRFVASEAQTYNFRIRILTLDQPTWRTKAHKALKPVAVQTPGANAWLLEKEDSALFLAELQRRGDFREHASPFVLVNNGQTATVPGMRPRDYIRDIVLRPDTYSGYEVQNAQVEEGYVIDFSPLMSIDRRMIDATIKLDIDQVEKILPVNVEAPAPGAPRQRVQIEVPQMSRFRFHERFHWPTEQVLLIGMGMAPLPVPAEGKASVAGIPLPIGTSVPRGDLLLLIECKGLLADAARVPPGSGREARTPGRGR